MKYKIDQSARDGDAAIPMEHHQAPRLGTSFTALINNKYAPAQKHWGRLINGGEIGLIRTADQSAANMIPMAIAISMASGVAFIGHKPDQPRAVVLVTDAMSPRTLSITTRRVAKSFGENVHAPNLTFITPRDVGALPSLMTASGQAEFEQFFDNPWEVAIIDSYVAASPGSVGVDTNRDVLLDWAFRVRNLGKTVIFVAREEASNQTSPGLQILTPVFDWIMLLTTPREIPEEASFSTVMSWPRARHLSLQQANDRLVCLIMDDSGSSQFLESDIDSSRPAAREAQRLKDKGWTQERIAEKLGCSRSTVCRMLQSSH